MIKNIFGYYKNLDKITYKILINGLKFCFALGIVSVLILLTYHSILLTPFLYHTGLALFKLSLIWSIEFVICALVVDSIKKHII